MTQDGVSSAEFQNATEEMPDDGFGRLVEQFLRRCALQHGALGNERDGVRYGAGESHFVGAEDDFLAAVDQLANQFEDFDRHLWIKRRGGFVEK